MSLVVVLESIPLLAFVLYGCALAVLFFQKRRSFPFHFTVCALGGLAYALLDQVAVGLILAGKARATGTVSDQMALFRTIVATCIWVAYVWKSRRVAATFVNRAPRRSRRRRAPLTTDEDG